MTHWIPVKGIVTKGHGVASGKAQSARFPQGTLEMQKPFFRGAGIFLESYFLGTINLSIAPREYQVKRAKSTVRNVKWSADSPPEDFSFFDCRIFTSIGKLLDGLIYYPHPETKPEHFQSPDILEILTGFIDGLSYGDELICEVNSEQIIIF